MLSDKNLSDRIAEHLKVDLRSGESISSQVTRGLKKAVISGNIRPGEMLSEKEAATILGISRQPVREAILNLRELGFIQVFPQRGTQILKISTSAVENARYLREAIECAIVRDAASSISGAQLSSLRANLQRQEQSTRDNDRDEFFELDERFHRLLAEIAGRPQAWDFVELIKPQMDRVRFMDLKDVHSLENNLREHTLIVDALEHRDGPGSVKMMETHLRGVLTSMERIKSEYPEMFDDI